LSETGEGGTKNHKSHNVMQTAPNDPGNSSQRKKLAGAAIGSGKLVRKSGESFTAMMHR